MPENDYKLPRPVEHGSGKEMEDALRELSIKNLDISNGPDSSDIKGELVDRWLLPSTGGKEEMFGKELARQIDDTEDEKTKKLKTLLKVETSIPTTKLEFKSKGVDSNIVGYKEVSITATNSNKAFGQSKTAFNSTSMERKPESVGGFIRGKSGYYPFKPGGMDDIFIDDDLDTLSRLEIEKVNEIANLEKAFEKGKLGIKTIPPGFVRGLDFDERTDEEQEEFLLQREEDVSMVSLYMPMLDTGAVGADRRKLTTETQDSNMRQTLDPRIEVLLPNDNHFKTSSMAPSMKMRIRPVVAKRDWAHIVDINREIKDFEVLVPDMAKTYPFELDTFQKEAIYHMEIGESVFVAAHTSAGKTVVAEYAIALAAKHMTRAIYTSPIKALSNQKFRDFQRTFSSSSIGILTGDVQINPEAPCLIMTTEILRSMLYKGADLIRDVEWVIFDEVHYVNDVERGVVWEEVIIMLPDHIGIILLSATVPNTKEFADWVGRTKKKDIYVISTPKRPVPLEHFLYSGKELHKIVDSKGQFLGQGCKDAMEAIKRKQDKEREAAEIAPLSRMAPVPGRRGQLIRGSSANRGGGGASRAKTQARGAMKSARGEYLTGRNAQRLGDATLWIHLIGLLRKKELLPVVIFTFSKKRCEENAASMPNTDLCTASEKSEVHTTIERSLTRLNNDDKKLPQIMNMRNLLNRGIGVHHGGLLPIVKEIVELLFARGLVKVLFATETFAMGVNMPTKCVVFSDTRKHDGRTFRDLLPGEYTQMSGRAGRRGLDSTGTVIIVSNREVPDTAALIQMLLGQPTKLQSQFRLTYTMILNLMRVETLRVEEMIKRSFSENASQKLLPEHQKKIKDGESQLKSLIRIESGLKREEMEAFYNVQQRLQELNMVVIEGALAHSSATKIISSGRIVILSDGHFRDNPAVLLQSGPASVSSTGLIERIKQFHVLAFVPTIIREEKIDMSAECVPPRWPPSPKLSGNLTELTFQLAVVPITSISLVTCNTMKVDSRAIIEKQQRNLMESALADFVTTFKSDKNTNLTREADWVKIRGLEFREALKEREELAKNLPPFAIGEEGFQEEYQSLHRERVLQNKLAELRMAISEQNLELLPDYEVRINVLKELQFVSDDLTVLLKGRVACEINSANELILTELILENTFANYEPEEVVALLSCFVFQEKTDVEPLLTSRLEEGRSTILTIAERVRLVQARHRADTVDEGFSTELKFGLVEVVYEWAKGTAFSQITALTDVQEGTIVRTITRLDETCREVRDAARIVGNADLFAKMEQSQLKIRRDIIFCGSLYF